jgi:hypothetical protein
VKVTITKTELEALLKAQDDGWATFDLDNYEVVEDDAELKGTGTVDTRISLAMSKVIGSENCVIW